MINRRQLLGAGTAAATLVTLGTGAGATNQTDDSLPFQNASFITTSNHGTPTASPVASPAASPVPAELRGYLLGDPDAPNTLQLYADYRCPHCRQFAAEIEPHILEDYVKPGKLNIEYLDFTVIGVPSFDALGDDTIESVQAAEAAACAAEQSGYLAYRDWLFDGPLQTNEGDFTDDNLIAAAGDLGLDAATFADSLSSEKYESSIIAEVSTGIDRGVQGTPAMVLNGGEPFYVPNNGYDGLKELLDRDIDS